MNISPILKFPWYLILSFLLFPRHTELITLHRVMVQTCIRCLQESGREININFFSKNLSTTEVYQ